MPQPVGAPVSSGGSDPVSIAISGNLVYVANAGASEPNVTGFSLAPNGVLYPLPDSTVPLPAGSGPDDVLFDPTGQQARRPARQHLDDRELSRRLGRPPARGPGLAASRPRDRDRSARSSGRRNPSQLFVSNAHGGEGNGTVSAFNVSCSR